MGRAAMNAGYRHRADDLRQEVWSRFIDPERTPLRYYKAERGPFGPFIRRLAYQQALAAIQVDRRQNVEGATTYTDDVEDPSVAGMFATMIQTDFYDQLMKRASEELDADEWLLLNGIYNEGLSAQKFARRHGINGNTIYKRHQRLRDRLRKWADQLLKYTRSEDFEDDEGSKPAAAAVMAVIVAALTATPVETEAEPEPEDSGVAPLISETEPDSHG